MKVQEMSRSSSKTSSRFPGVVMFKNVIHISLILLFIGCSVNLIVHDETIAAKKAEEFGEVVFVRGETEEGYGLLASQVRRSVPLQDFEDIIRQMHPKTAPTFIKATEYEKMPEQRAMTIYLFGKRESEEFHYRLVMLGTATSDYRVGGFFRGSGPYPTHKLRHTLNNAEKPGQSIHENGAGNPSHNSANQ